MYPWQKYNAYLKKNRKELLEIKNIIMQIKNSVAVLENKVEYTAQKIEQKDKKENRETIRKVKDGSLMSR